MVQPSEKFISELAARYRVLVIGGMAIIGHGYSRPTMDADIWLDPLDSPQSWANAISSTCSLFSGLAIHTLPGWRSIQGQEVADAATEVGMVRINGLDCPLDIFRCPNEFPENSFDEVHSHSTLIKDGTWLPDPLDLIITKLNTGRDKDLQDIRYLESVIRQRYSKLLPVSALEEVKKLFDRYLDWEVCDMAMTNPDPAVKGYAVQCLHSMAQDGDPFALALLEQRKIPYSNL